MHKTETRAFRERWINFIYDLQLQVCTALEETDGSARFLTDEWKRKGGGGGKTRTLVGGKVFEKGGVNCSVVYGKLTENMRNQLGMNGARWFAGGISIVMHPQNPFVPTVHGNWRYFELYDVLDEVSDRWFGGGADLTPCYLFEEDARHFHQILKKAMDPWGPALYPRCKKDCDAYFVNRHREGEMRGIGGVFYDGIRFPVLQDAEKWLLFQQSNANAFLPAYLPIVRKRKDTSYGPEQIEWQEIRRGRYVEFNLLHDRGTRFGLQSGGRTESILMSLPPRARWQYRQAPQPGSPEDALWQACLHPREWA
jgi:coproporphyrinogen III oxidase